MNSQRWIKVSLFVMMAAALLVIFRVLLLQLSPWSSNYVSLSNQSENYKVVLPPPQVLKDRRSEVLAQSIVSRDLYVDPEFLFSQFLAEKQEELTDSYLEQLKQYQAEYEKELKKIAHHFKISYGLDSRTTLASMQMLHQDNSKLRRFVILKKDLSSNEELALEKKKKELRDNKRKKELKLYKAFNHVEGQKRIYPEGPRMAHITAGAELVYKSRLSGGPGQVLITRNVRRQIFSPQKMIKIPRSGQSLTLTIDTSIQRIVEKAMSKAVEKWEPKNACILVMNPYNGEILALSVRPNYDPNHILEKDIELGRVVNMAVNKCYEPGSIMKPFILAAALEEGSVTLQDQFFCEGRAGWRPKGRSRAITDFHPYNKYMSVTDIIVNSSNIGTAKIADQMIRRSKEQFPGAVLHKWVKDLGFGQKTGVDLPGEIRGIAYSLSRWGKSSWASISFGHEIAVTPVQYLSAFCSLANGGYLVHPHLAAGLQQQPKRIFSRKTASAMADILHQVTVRGTAKRAQVEGVEVCAKTGTAEKVVNGVYDRNKNVASITAFAPKTNAKIAVLVMFDEPTLKNGRPTGGVVCGPVVQEIIKETLDYLQLHPLNVITPNKGLLATDSVQ